MATERKLLTEPVTRPDGETITIVEVEGGVRIDIPGVSAYYTRDEVMKLGSGDFGVGISRIGESTYNAPINDLLPGRKRQLYEDLGDI